MKILITGGSGFLGRALTNHFIENLVDCKIFWASRNTAIKTNNSNVTVLSYEQLLGNEFDIIINLAGAGIAEKRWSKKRKAYLMSSRIKPTQAVINYIKESRNKPRLLISSSAIGWYGNQQNVILDESSNPCECSCIIRTGIVLHSSGGMLKKLLPFFTKGLGGVLGNGNQVMSWISLRDWVRAVEFIVNHNSVDDNTDKEISSISKIYNLTAPYAVTNKEFCKILGEELKRPTFIKQPQWILKAVLGKMSELLLEGQNVIPQQLLNEGFVFSDDKLEKALKHIRGK